MAQQQVTNNTWMQVDYPRGKTSIGYISQEGERQLISMRGAKYSVPDLLESGYTFNPLVAMTDERVEALEIVLNMAGNDEHNFVLTAQEDEVRAALEIIQAMLNELTGATE